MSKMFQYADEDEQDDNLLKDGERLRVPMYMKDLAGNFLVDGLGRPLPAEGRRSGFVFADNRPSDHAERYAQHRDYQKAELSARYRGGFQVGDHVHLGDRNMQVTGHNPETGKVILSDTAQLSADEIKREAYDAGVDAMTNAWRR